MTVIIPTRDGVNGQTIDEKAINARLYAFNFLHEARDQCETGDVDVSHVPGAGDELPPGVICIPCRHPAYICIGKEKTMFVADLDKQPAEKKLERLSYDGWLYSGETLADIQLFVDPTGDAEDLVADEATVEGSMAQLMLSKGIDGEDYTVTIRVTTSLGQIKEDELMVRVLETPGD